MVSRSCPQRTVTQRNTPCHPKLMDWYLVQTVAIRSLNDELRTRFRGGTVSVSDEVKELGPVVVANALLMMVDATEFDDDEHMNGHFHFCNRVFRWSISYGESRNPANAKTTKRELLLSL